MFEMAPQELRELLHERAFSSEELIQMTGVDKFTLRNWLKRGTPEIGAKHKLGRWVFSPADMMRISAMIDLVEEIGMLPSTAAQLAETPVKLVEWHCEQSAKNHADPDWDGYSPLEVALENYVAVALIGEKGVKIHYAYWDGDQLVFSRDQTELDKATRALLRVTHIVLGAGLIADDIMDKVRRAMDAEAEA
ncbi:MerR family transcriptional regulator [Rhodovulum marinum]|uniref:MerR-like DNA binding protein n=1 Tax=Rhodovulum marinum TaxID=320662 RepID=A0A4R2PXD2_9RHOB|nr:MerR family transcriptional regulator [Rhodovulum marinum]TCP39798.1 MerR-like DNA binding protein [Rhodovulum marinum]